MGNLENLKSRREFMRSLVIGGTTALIGGGALADVQIISAASRMSAAADTVWAQVPEILQRIKPPVFPKRDFIITRFGAVIDGKSDCTAAFAKAIAACHEAGGGRVVVPAGVFATGAIHLKSNVNLHVTAGATIAFSTDVKKYLPVVFTRWEGVELMNYSPFIYAFEQQNIGISGGGTLDGQADAGHWWAWRERQLGPNGDRARLMDMATRGVPVAQRVFGAGRFLRPVLSSRTAVRTF